MGKERSCPLLCGYMEVDFRLEAVISSIRFQSTGCKGVKNISLLESSELPQCPARRDLDEDRFANH